MMKKYLFVLIALSILDIHAQKVHISLDKDTILIGDHVNLHLLVDANENETVLFPVFKDSISSFDLIESYSTDTITNGYSKRYLITQFNHGNYQLGRIPTIVVRTNGVKDTIYSNRVDLVVNTIEVDTSQAIKPIKAVKQLPFPWKAFLKKWSVIVVPIILLIAILIWYLAKRKKIFEKPETPKTMLDYYKETLQKLEEIEKQKLWENNEIKAYYFGISEVLRTYLEGRFHIQAMESTTDEIKQQLDLDKSFKTKVTEILRQADLAKFAKFKPLPEENKRMMKMAKNFVRHTKPKIDKQEDV